MKKLTIGMVTLALLAVGSGVEAQSWDTPSFMGPRPGADLGLYLVDAEFGDIGIHGIWRTTSGMNLGLRLGFVDAGDGVIQLGAETWGDIILEGADFPLDLTWTAGAGASMNGGATVSVPAGVSIGRTFDVGSVSVQAYGHPRLALIAGEDAAGDLNLDLDSQFDLGADVYLSQSVTLRIGTSFGTGDALGIGVAWRR